jgi:predicted DNA-binding transcriptional regulator YafY
MRRADRLFQIVQFLRRKGSVTAARLAEELEVSERTIYRDVRDLQASGVPIAGEAGVGYRLDSRYELPPMMFTLQEVEALVLGARMVESWADAELKQAARGVLMKIDHVLPEVQKQRVERTALFALPLRASKAALEHMGKLREATTSQRLVKMSYVDVNGAGSARTVRPLGLYFWGSTWTLAAWCELRNDFRNFRLDRIDRLRVLKQTFELIPPCTLEDFVRACTEDS